MSGSEQAINLSEWKELHAELEEVREKRDRLQAENNRLKALIELTRKECDEARGELRDMTAERDNASAQWQECCEDRSRQVAALREQVQVLDAALQEMRAQRDTFEQYRDQMRDSRDAARKASSEAQEQLRQMTAERDAVKEANGSQYRMVQALQGDVSDLEVQVSQWQVGHDAIREQLAQAKEGADMFEQENAALQDTIRQLRAKQIHDDLPGILMVIQRAAEQARELI